MREILHVPGREIVDSDNAIALRQQGVSQMRAEEARGSGHKNFPGSHTLRF